MDITIRRENPADYRAVEEVTREAFWNHHCPGCCEHYLAHVLRDNSAFIPELDLVAEIDGQIVGNIMYAKTNIQIKDGTQFPTITFGPISVLPDYQKKGVGTALIQESKRLACELGFQSIFILGDPDYYSRVGFVAAEHFHVTNGEGKYAAALQGCELVPNALDGVSGRFLEGAAYEIDPIAAEQFDKSFSPKEKISGGASQERFQELVKMVRDV